MEKLKEKFFEAFSDCSFRDQHEIWQWFEPHLKPTPAPDEPTEPTMSQPTAPDEGETMKLLKAMHDEFSREDYEIWCDHSVGICACETIKLLDQVEKHIDSPQSTKPELAPVQPCKLGEEEIESILLEEFSNWYSQDDPEPSIEVIEKDFPDEVDACRRVIKAALSQSPRTVTVEEIKKVIKMNVDHTAYGPGELIGVDEAAQAIHDLINQKNE